MSSEIYSLFKKGQANLQAQHQETESKKSGVLRGGSVGCLLPGSGEVIGQCAALTYLRFKGVNVAGDEDNNKSLMFEAGRTNEDSWYETLRASGWDGGILREEEIPISYSLPNGTLVTGRPDMVLLKEGKPHVGIELKLVCSIWTARAVLINKTPKMNHLIQAAHYMWKLDIPFEIWYTNRGHIEASPDFHLNDYPGYREPGSEHFEYQFYEVYADPKSGKFKRRSIKEDKFLQLHEDGAEVEVGVRKYLPFVQGFRLEFTEDGYLQFQDACQPGEWTRTIINKDGIEKYYTLVSEMKTVPPEPLTLKPNGKKESYKISSYCSLGKLCCKNTAGMQASEWVEEVKKELKYSEESAEE